MRYDFQRMLSGEDDEIFPPEEVRDLARTHPHVAVGLYGSESYPGQLEHSVHLELEGETSELTREELSREDVSEYAEIIREVKESYSEMSIEQKMLHGVKLLAGERPDRSVPLPKEYSMSCQ